MQISDSSVKAIPSIKCMKVVAERVFQVFKSSIKDFCIARLDRKHIIENKIDHDYRNKQ